MRAGWARSIALPLSVRGRFSKKLFDETCLREYASVFPTVCGDFAFYRFPTAASGEAVRQTPGTFAGDSKCPSRLPFPCGRRIQDTARRQARKPGVPRCALFLESFLNALEIHRSRSAC